MEVTGKIKLIKPTETIGSNGFQKRDIVVTTEEQYPQYLLIQFVQDKCSILDQYQVGQNVKISINLRGREWVSPQGETKYFNTIQGWKIEGVSQSVATTPPPAPAQNDNSQENEPDDLPF